VVAVYLCLGLRGSFVAIAASYAGGIAGRAGRSLRISYGLADVIRQKVSDRRRTDERDRQEGKSSLASLSLSCAREAAV